MVVGEGGDDGGSEGGGWFTALVHRPVGRCAPNGVTYLFQYAIHVFCLPT